MGTCRTFRLERKRRTLISNVDLIDFDEKHFLIKKEKMPDGKTKVMLKEKLSGNIIQKVLKD